MRAFGENIIHAVRKIFQPPIFFFKENELLTVQKKRFFVWILVRSTPGRAGLPRERKRSGSRGKRTSSGMSERRRLRRCEGYGACEDAARGRSVGACAGLQFYRQPLPLTPAPIAARRRQGVSSETTAPSTATLRQQGVDKSLLVLGGTLVAAAYSTHRTRAARYKPLTLSIPPANSTPAFAGRWSLAP